MEKTVYEDGAIATISGLLSAEECAAWIERGERLGFAEAPLSTAMGAQRRREVRNNDRAMIDDPQGAADLWRRLADLIDEPIAGCAPVGLNERLRFYRYDPGQRFRWHTDGVYERVNGERSLLTFLLYLNGGFEGGATRFADGTVVPEAGLGLLFAHPLWHRGEEVRAGRKYVLRSDVMFEPGLPPTITALPSPRPENWMGLRYRLVFQENGGIDWQRRRFARTWSLRRLGKAGAREAVFSLLQTRSPCLLACEDEPRRPQESRLGAALDEGLRGEGHRWIIDARGRWLVEVSADRRLSLERFDP